MMRKGILPQKKQQETQVPQARPSLAEQSGNPYSRVADKSSNVYKTSSSSTSVSEGSGERVGSRGKVLFYDPITGETLLLRLPSGMRSQIVIITHEGMVRLKSEITGSKHIRPENSREELQEMIMNELTSPENFVADAGNRGKSPELKNILYRLSSFSGMKSGKHGLGELKYVQIPGDSPFQSVRHSWESATRLNRGGGSMGASADNTLLNAQKPHKSIYSKFGQTGSNNTPGVSVNTALKAVSTNSGDGINTAPDVRSQATRSAGVFRTNYIFKGMYSDGVKETEGRFLGPGLEEDEIQALSGGLTADQWIIIIDQQQKTLNFFHASSPRTMTFQVPLAMASRLGEFLHSHDGAVYEGYIRSKNQLGAPKSD